MALEVESQQTIDEAIDRAKQAGETLITQATQNIEAVVQRRAEAVIQMIEAGMAAWELKISHPALKDPITFKLTKEQK